MKTSSAIRVLNGNTRAVDKRLVRLQKFIFYLYIYIYIYSTRKQSGSWRGQNSKNVHLGAS